MTNNNDDEEEFYAGFEPISSNGFSHDVQAEDAINFLRVNWPDEYDAIKAKFPEIVNLIFDGAWLDTDSMGVDVEYSSWLTDEIESTGKIWWIEGEPYGKNP